MSWVSTLECLISLCRNLQETSSGLNPGLNLEKFARVSKNLRKFSLSEWQFIGPTTKNEMFILSTGGNRRFRSLAQGYTQQKCQEHDATEMKFRHHTILSV